MWAGQGSCEGERGENTKRMVGGNRSMVERSRRRKEEEKDVLCWPHESGRGEKGASDGVARVRRLWANIIPKKKAKNYGIKFSGTVPIGLTMRTQCRFVPRSLLG